MPEGLSKNNLKKSKRKMWAKLPSRSTFAGFENHYPGPCHVSGSENLWISFWKLVRSFNGIYQNDQGTSSLKSSAITIFVVFWQKYLKSSSSLAETHWFTWTDGISGISGMTWLPQSQASVRLDTEARRNLRNLRNLRTGQDRTFNTVRVRRDLRLMNFSQKYLKFIFF